MRFRSGWFHIMEGILLFSLPKDPNCLYRTSYNAGFRVYRGFCSRNILYGLGRRVLHMGT